MKQRSVLRVVVLAIVATGGGWVSWVASGQTVARAPVPSGAVGHREPARFEFLVVESFDARYLHDTPGHRGRAASGRVAPRIALGDPVMRGSVKVGTITYLDWNEARESLEVEFNPLPEVRICISDPVWVPIPAVDAH